MGKIHGLSIWDLQRMRALTGEKDLLEVLTGDEGGSGGSGGPGSVNWLESMAEEEKAKGGSPWQLGF